MKEELPQNMAECARSYASLSVYFWNSEGWTPRNDALMEAVVKQARTTSFAWFRKYDLQRRQGMQESRTEEEEMRW